MKKQSTVAVIGHKIFDSLSDKKYLKLKYFYTMHKRLNLKNPETYTEKLQWLKLYHHIDRIRAARREDHVFHASCAEHLRRPDAAFVDLFRRGDRHFVTAAPRIGAARYCSGNGAPHGHRLRIRCGSVVKIDHAPPPVPV